MSVELKLSPPLTNQELNALFSAGGPGAGWPSWQRKPDSSDWHRVLSHSLAYVGAFDGDALIGFVNVAWDGRDHAFLLDTRVHPSHRMRGLGRRLVICAVEHARAAHCAVMHVDYTAELGPFYAACGFTHTPAGLLWL